MAIMVHCFGSLILYLENQAPQHHVVYIQLNKYVDIQCFVEIEILQPENQVMKVQYSIECHLWGVQLVFMTPVGKQNLEEIGILNTEVMDVLIYQTMLRQVYMLL